jgi:hypothetical protein
MLFHFALGLALRPGVLPLGLLLFLLHISGSPGLGGVGGVSLRNRRDRTAETQGSQNEECSKFLHKVSAI